MSSGPSTMHQILGPDGKPYTAYGCFNPWIGSGSDVFGMPHDGNKIEPLLTGEKYFASLIAEVDSAQKEVLIIGWQVNWDALLAPGVRLYDLIYRNAKRGISFYIMPWDDTDPIQTYDDQTRLVLNDINRRLKLVGKQRRIHVQLSRSYASVNQRYFSHHQKSVIVDRKASYMGGIDLCYGRYDDETYNLLANAGGREVLNRYNACIAWIKPLNEGKTVDPDKMSGPADTAKPSPPVSDGSSVDIPDLKSNAEIQSDKAFGGGWQVPYTANTPGVDMNTPFMRTLDETRQPRMPWQDAHCRIEGPVVSDIICNFVVRWNIGNKKSPLPLPDSPGLYPKPGGAKIQFLRSAPANMRSEEYKHNKDAFAAPPRGTDDSIQQGMIRLIRNAAYFIYIETQFFVGDFGEIVGETEPLSPAGEYIRTGVDGIGDSALSILRLTDEQRAAMMDRMPQNRICQEVVARIRKAIFDSRQAPFHVYITLPVHPEGALTNASIAVQVYWTMQTISFGSHSLLNGIRRALKAKELKDKKEPYQQVLDDPENDSYEDIPLEACFKYVTLLNLRNWAQIGKDYVTEQIYIHTKIMVVDDRFAIIGSANTNDRSLLGERDSEMAVLVIDTDTEQCDIGLGRATPTRGFARKLRMGIWEKIFGIAGNVRPATHLKQAIEQPANPASWAAIQKQAQANAEAYEKAFPFVPRNWSKDDKGNNIPTSILPTWDTSLEPPPGKKSDNWKKGNIGSPVPSQENFWNSPQYNKDGVAGLASIKGFITALPIHWTERERLKIPFPTSLITRKGPTGNPAETTSATFASHNDGAETEAQG